MEERRLNLSDYNNENTNNKFNKNALKWAEYMKSLHHLLEGKFIYDHEYDDIRNRLIDKFCKDDTHASN